MVKVVLGYVAASLLLVGEFVLAQDLQPCGACDIAAADIDSRSYRVDSEVGLVVRRLENQAFTVALQNVTSQFNYSSTICPSSTQTIDMSLKGQAIQPGRRIVVAPSAVTGFPMKCVPEGSFRSQKRAEQQPSLCPALSCWNGVDPLESTWNMVFNPVAPDQPSANATIYTNKLVILTVKNPKLGLALELHLCPDGSSQYKIQGEKTGNTFLRQSIGSIKTQRDLVDQCTFTLLNGGGTSNYFAHVRPALIGTMLISLGAIFIL